MRSSLKVVIASLVALLLSFGGAAAQPRDEPVIKRPPRAVFISGEARQRGNLGSYCWSYPSGRFIVGECGTAGGYRFPRFDRALGGHKSVIRLRWDKRPSEVVARSWRRVDGERQPIGRGTPVDFKLSARRTPGEGITAWDARFTLPSRPGHLYMSAFIVWPEGRENNGGDASYDFHLRLRTP